MPEWQQEHAVKIARHAYATEKVLRDMAGVVKKEFDKEYGKTWHCVVGKSFASYVTYQSERFVFFKLDELYFMLFQTA
jgi:dynein light chain LC8-type